MSIPTAHCTASGRRSPAEPAGMSSEVLQSVAVAADWPSMGMSERNRRKSIEAAARLLPPNPIRAYASGVTGGYPPMVTGALFAGWAALFAASMALAGGVIVPGFLVFYAVKYSLNGPRGVLVVDGGIALVRRSFWTSRPNAIVALLP